MKAIAISQFDDVFVRSQSIRYRYARLPWISLPLRDGAGFDEVMSYHDGTALYGCFLLLVRVGASMERRGVFARHGEPLTQDQIARMSRIPPAEIGSAVKRLRAVGWLVDVDVIPEMISGVISGELSGGDVLFSTSQGSPGSSPSDGTRRDETGRDGTSTASPFLSEAVKKKPRERFTPPTVEEVAEFVEDQIKRGFRDYGKVNPRRFVAHYDSNGWKVGRNPMKNWKAAVATWAAKENE